MADNHTILHDYQDAQIGDEIAYEGITLKVKQLFRQGKEAKNSGLKYFLTVPKGVLGCEEI